jgi:uncharacterized phage-associated protein
MSVKRSWIARYWDPARRTLKRRVPAKPPFFFGSLERNIMSPAIPVAFSHDLDVASVAEFFIQQDALREEPDVTPMKLQKLLYLAQANYLASTGERLFSEDVEAYEHGPVVHRAWQLYPGKQIIATSNGSTFASAANDRMPADVETFVDCIWVKYKDQSAGQLRGLTHTQAPWKDNYERGSYRPLIPDEEMAQFFRQQVPVEDRVFHDAVVLMPQGFLEEFNEDDMAATLSRFLNS